MNFRKSYLNVLSIFITTIFLFPFLVFALDSNDLKGPDLSSPGKEISYDIVVSSESAIDEYKTTLSFETSILELTGIETKGNWKNTSSFSNNSPCELTFTHESGVTGETTVATIRFKVKTGVTKTETIISIEGQVGIQEDDTISNLEKKTKTIKIKSEDNTLSDLKLNGKTVTNFSPKTDSYSMQVEATTTIANIDAVLNDKTATFEDKYGSRAVPLEYGENIIEIHVVSASGNVKKYVININRLDNRGTNNDLKSITLNGGKIKIGKFESDTLKYTIKTHKLTTIEVDAVAVDSKATVKIEKPDKLVIGTNNINITVTSEDGKDKKYQVILNNVDYDIDTTLKSLEIFGLEEDFSFKPNVYDYEFRYNKKYKDGLVISAKPNSVEDDVKIDEALLDSSSSNLKVDSVIKIRVYADGVDGVESFYTISFVKDDRINFFLILGIIIFIILLVVFIYLFVKYKKEHKVIEEKSIELEKTKEIKKINLE